MASKQTLVVIRNTHDTTQGRFHELRALPMPRDVFLAAYKSLQNHGGGYIQSPKGWYIPVENWPELNEALYDLQQQIESRVEQEQSRIRALAVELCPSVEEGELEEHPYDSEFKANRNEIGKKQGWTCAFCCSQIEHIHHIIPVRMGGSSDISNLIGLCSKCHGQAHAAYGRESQRRAYQSDSEFYSSIIEQLQKAPDAK